MLYYPRAQTNNVVTTTTIIIIIIIIIIITPGSNESRAHLDEHQDFIDELSKNGNEEEKKNAANEQAFLDSTERLTYPELQSLLETIYSIFNPLKVPDVPKILEKFKDKEMSLLANLRVKYKIGMDPYEAQVYSIYESFNPEKMHDVQGILSKYHDNENLLLDRLRIKYRIRMHPIENEVYTLLETYDPDRLEDVPFLLQQYPPDRSEEMITMLRDQYNNGKAYPPHLIMWVMMAMVMVMSILTSSLCFLLFLFIFSLPSLPHDPGKPISLRVYGTATAHFNYNHYDPRRACVPEWALRVPTPEHPAAIVNTTPTNNGDGDDNDDNVDDSLLGRASSQKDTTVSPNSLLSTPLVIENVDRDEDGDNVEKQLAVQTEKATTEVEDGDGQGVVVLPQAEREEGFLIDDASLLIPKGYSHISKEKEVGKSKGKVSSTGSSSTTTTTTTTYHYYDYHYYYGGGGNGSGGDEYTNIFSFSNSFSSFTIPSYTPPRFITPFIE